MRGSISSIVCRLFFAASVTTGSAYAADEASSVPASVAGMVLTKEVVVHATLPDVWYAWTTREGIASFFSPDSKIELELGGAYELYMGMENPDESGTRGSEGCKLLSYVPLEMLSFEWSFPPKVMSLRKAHAKTYVVLRFEPLEGERVRVRFAQAGWQAGDDWRQGWIYFDRAWTSVMKQLADRVRSTPTGRGAVKAMDAGKKWTDGNVEVCSHALGTKQQDFEIVVPASPERVWELLATSAGLKQLGGKEPVVELQLGGKYWFWPGANNRVLSYLPNAMLSTSGSAPPEFPTVRKGGTWGAYFIEPFDGQRTKVRLTMVGWQKGEEWDAAYQYFLKNNAVWMNRVYKVLTEKADTSTNVGNKASESAVRDRVYRTAQDSAAPTSHLAFFKPMIGTWESRSREADGGEFHTKVFYEWGLGGKVLKGQSFVIRDGKANLVYETLCGWDPARKSAVFQSFSAWDAFYSGEARANGDTLEFEWDGFGGDKKTHYRQTIRFTDADTYVWTVFTQTADGWEQSKETTFHRIASAASRPD